MHYLHYVLIALSLVILCTFLVELLLVMISIGVRKFCKHWLYVLDLFVVLVSVVTEIVVLLSVTGVMASLSAFTGVLILLRLWRFLRIGHVRV